MINLSFYMAILLLLESKIKRILRRQHFSKLCKAFRYLQGLLSFYAPPPFRSVGRSTNCFRSFSSHRMIILKGNLVYRLIMIIFKSSSIWIRSSNFSQSYAPYDVGKFQLWQSPSIFFAEDARIEMKFVNRFIKIISR